MIRTSTPYQVHPIWVRRNHRSPADPARMNEEPAQYTIRVAGRLGATTLSAFPPSLIAEHQPHHTVLTGLLDRSALYGVLSQMEVLCLELVELTRST